MPFVGQERSENTCRASSAGYFSGSVGIGDLDGDGDADLAVADQYDNTVSILPGCGDGTFDPRRYGADLEPISMAIADLNVDGRLDVAVTNNISNDVSVPLNTGGLPWLGVPAAPAAPRIALRARPNPAVGPVQFRFTLPGAAAAVLRIRDLAGRPGAHAVQWGGRGARGAAVADGIYFVELRAGSERITARVAIAR